jgi:hypothetical protein
MTDQHLMKGKNKMTHREAKNTYINLCIKYSLPLVRLTGDRFPDLPKLLNSIDGQFTLCKERTSDSIMAEDRESGHKYVYTAGWRTGKDIFKRAYSPEEAILKVLIELNEW